MKLALRRSEYFEGDFDLQYRWYLGHAGVALADRFKDAVWTTFKLLAVHPELGYLRNFRHPALQDLRSFRVDPPFGVHLIFYRHNASELFVERLMHGARHLPRRLVEPPRASD